MWPIEGNITGNSLVFFIPQALRMKQALYITKRCKRDIKLDESATRFLTILNDKW